MATASNLSKAAAKGLVILSFLFFGGLYLIKLYEGDGLLNRETASRKQDDKGAIVYYRMCIYKYDLIYDKVTLSASGVYSMEGLSKLSCPSRFTEDADWIAVDKQKV